MKKFCNVCDDPFKGRPNRAYCTQRCKSAANNVRYAERTQTARSMVSKIKANRSILSKLHQVFGDKPMPIVLIKESSLDLQSNTGKSADKTRLCFLDFVLQELPNNYCQILKIA